MTTPSSSDGAAFGPVEQLAQLRDDANMTARPGDFNLDQRASLGVLVHPAVKGSAATLTDLSVMPEGGRAHPTRQSGAPDRLVAALVILIQQASRNAKAEPDTLDSRRKARSA
jgi:hypothetical protein